MKLHLDSARGYYLSRVGLNIMNLQLVNIQCYFPSASIDHSSLGISAASSSETVSRTSTNFLSDHSRSRMELQHMSADLDMSNKIIINLATPTNDNDAENNSCADGV